MFKKLFLIPLIMLVLTACGPTVYDQQAQVDAQRTYQSQYSSYALCYHNFPFDHDCYVGTNGMWYSPPYYPWGAVVHYNHVVSYGHVVPVGGTWIHTSYPVNVDYSRSRSYVSSRSTYYKTQTSYNATRTASNTTRPADSKVSKINFGSTSTTTKPSAPTTSTPTRSSFSSSSSSTSRQPSRISFGSSSSGSSRSSSSSSSSRRH